MNDLTPTSSTNPAEPTSARAMYERFLREGDRRAKGLPPEPPEPTRGYLKGEQLERPDDVLTPNPEAAEVLRHPESWPAQTGDGLASIWIVRRRKGGEPRGLYLAETALLFSDDPSLHRVTELGWEAD